MPQGFFSKKETQSVSAVDGKIHSCASCGLYKNCHSPKMKPYGKGEKNILIIGEAPEQAEDEKGKPWQSQAGRLLHRIFDKFGIRIYRDCISVNAVNCRTDDKDRAPSIQEIDHCRSVIVWKALKEYMPKVIIVLGNSAMKSVIGHRWSGGAGINKWRGYTIPDQELKTWVCPTFDPSYILHKNKPRDMMNIWMQDIEQALNITEEKFPRYKSPEIEYVSDLSFLDDLPKKLYAFDYETTGIKPHAKGHRIVSCSIADSENHAWSFKIPKTRAGRKPLRRWLANKSMSKIAQNIKFENQWSEEILKVPVRGWEWDTMLASHILDNRKGTAGLKFQTYAQFGILGYENEVQRYLKSSDEKGDNTQNNIRQLLKSRKGTRDLLKYGGLDSVYEYRLGIKQMKQLDCDFLPF